MKAFAGYVLTTSLAYSADYGNSSQNRRSEVAFWNETVRYDLHVQYTYLFHGYFVLWERRSAMTTIENSQLQNNKEF